MKNIFDYTNEGFEFLFEKSGNLKKLTVQRGSFSVSYSSVNPEQTFQDLLSDAIRALENKFGNVRNDGEE